MRRLYSPRRARRTRRARNTLKVQRDEQRFSARSCKSQIRSVGHAPRTVSVHTHSRQYARQRLFQTVAKNFNTCIVGLAIYFRQLGCLAEANNSRNIFSAGTAVALMMSPMKLGLYRSPCANVQRTNSLRSINLVRGDGKQIPTETFNVERHLSGRLHCVAVKVNVRLRGDSANFLNRLNRAEFVVRMHHANQNCFGPQCATNILRIDDSIGTYRNEGYFDSLLFKRLSSI